MINPLTKIKELYSPLNQAEKVLSGDPTVNAHIAMLRGKEYHTRPYYYLMGGNKYAHFTGVVVWPTILSPGYALIVGVDDEEPHNIQSLWEYTSQDGSELFKEMVKAQNKIGKKKHPEICETWYGESRQLMSFVSSENLKYSTKINIADPIDSDSHDRYDLYFEQLKTSLSNMNKAFYLNKCTDLRSDMSAYESGDKISPEKNPRICAAGCLLHTLYTLRPWEYAVETISLIPTDPGELEVFEERQQSKKEYDELWN